MIASEAHALKGGVGNFFADAAFAAADALESAARSGDIADAGNLLTKLEAELDRVKQAIAAILEE